MRDEHLEKNNRKKNAEHRRPYRGAKTVDLCAATMADARGARRTAFTVG